MIKKPKFAKSFVIDRSEWNPAGAYGLSALKGAGGKCCLGIYGEACNVPFNVTQVMPVSSQPWPKALFQKFKKTDGEKTEIVTLNQLLADANDDLCISQKWREQKIRNLFRKIGVSVSFTGKLRAVQ